MDEDLYWIWISRMKHMYYEVFCRLLAQCGRIENLWNLSKMDILKYDFLSPEIVEDITNVEYKRNLDKYLKYMNDAEIKMINCFDLKYPAKLRFIKNRPIVLFYKGNISCINDETVAIVGSRNCTEYGRKCSMYFSSQLAKKGVNIISGLAKGIDSIAHIQAINCGSKTIAVVGNGLDMVYPKENIRLAQKIIECNGAIISEYIVGTKPDKINFPRRNRIISGLANAVIVVEASKKSGSLITANYAINQGKEVWVVPGNIFSNTSVGCNELIRDGANVLTKIEDILR